MITTLKTVKYNLQKNTKGEVSTPKYYLLRLLLIIKTVRHNKSVLNLFVLQISSLKYRWLRVQWTRRVAAVDHRAYGFGSAQFGQIEHHLRPPSSYQTDWCMRGAGFGHRFKLLWVDLWEDSRLKSEVLAFRSRFTRFLISRNFWFSSRERARWRAWISSLSVDVI